MFISFSFRDKWQDLVFSTPYLSRPLFVCPASDTRPCHAQAGPKVLDFGKVCVTSKNVKNFSVSNGLEQYVLANVGFAAVPELAERSTPPGQVWAVGWVGREERDLKGSDGMMGLLLAMVTSPSDRECVKYPLLQYFPVSLLL